MKTWIILCGLASFALAHAADKIEVVKPTVLKPADVLKPIDPTERVQICGKTSCRTIMINDLMRQIERERSGGGDIIGNGGGLAEQNFTYALSQLPEFISETLNEGFVKGVDVTNLNKIYAVAKSESAKADKLVFLSGKNNPGIFSAANDPEIRLAKTGLTSEAPIFVNIDLLYSRTEDGTEILPMPVMIASLVHELGHQAGFTDHAYLDFLGARVRRMIEADFNRAARKLNGNLKIEMVSINLGSFSMPKLSLSIGDAFIPYEKPLYSVLRCRDGGLPRAARLSNQHWERAAEFGSVWITPFRAWASLTCVNKSGVSETEDRDLILDLRIDTSEELPMVEIVQLAIEN
ncbi:MAG: hypothetical protein K2P81_00320 [Bacteriovoracaceae bacterium]|nr:hypothetical protein [Bacteriovoracaceae bacterium]